MKSLLKEVHVFIPDQFGETPVVTLDEIGWIRLCGEMDRLLRRSVIQKAVYCSRGSKDHRIYITPALPQPPTSHLPAVI